METQDNFILLEKDEVHQWFCDQEISKDVQLIQNHHTYKPDYNDFNGNNHFEELRGMRDYHVNELGWDDIGQNLTTFPDGKVAVCRPLNEQPACIYQQNSGAICIENLGNFDTGQDAMTPDQKDTIILLNAVLCEKFNIFPDTDHIVYHHWFDLDTGERTNGSGKTKSCPGTGFFGGNKVENARENFIPLVVIAFASLQNISLANQGGDAFRSVVRRAVGLENGSATSLSKAVVTAGKLNVRNGPGTTYDVVDAVNKGEVVDIYDTKEGWKQIEAGEKWVSGDYLEELQQGKITVSALNVRSGPGTNHEAVEVLNEGAEVVIYENTDNWYRISSGEKWVSGDYVELM